MPTWTVKKRIFFLPVLPPALGGRKKWKKMSAFAREGDSLCVRKKPMSCNRVEESRGRVRVIEEREYQR